VTLLCIVLGFLWLTWTSLADQAQYAASHFQQLEKQAVDALPGWVRNAATPDSGDLQSAAAPYALRVGKSAVAAVVVAFLGFIVMLYLLIEADRTKAWFMAFVPKAQRARVEETLDESERVVFAYVAGNVITSVLAGVFIGVSTALLKVPGALLLAFVAAVFDFIPVMGFILSSVFGVVMALTVSPATAVIVFCLYVAYHFAENYVIGPWAYGGRLKLSNLAVVLAFAIGAEIAGVIGALIALPVAAVYPSIERIWLREELPEDTVRRHRAIERKAG
jgi:Predicted permease